MVDLLILLAVGLIVGLACGYIYREKKKGKVCVGCPYAGNCQSQRGKGSCNCQEPK